MLEWVKFKCKEVARLLFLGEVYQVQYKGFQLFPVLRLLIAFL